MANGPESQSLLRRQTPVTENQPLETPKFEGVFDKYRPKSGAEKLKSVGSKLYDLVGVNINLKGSNLSTSGGFGTPGSAMISGLGKKKDWSVGVYHDRTNPWRTRAGADPGTIREPKSKLGFHISKTF